MLKPNDRRPILLVEDDMIDVMTVKRAVKDLKIPNEIVVAKNGEEGLDYLKNKSNPRPFLILLDLNMPRLNGVEFLKIVKQDNDLRIIPVVVLTTSKDDQDKRNTFNTGIAGYMIKPVEYLQFVEVIRTINQYWSLSEHPE